MISGLGCQGKSIQTQEQAARLAKAALIEYVKKTNLSFGIDEFSQPQKDYFDKTLGVWVFYYESKDAPRHRVNILVDRFGNVEQHSMVENAPTVSGSTR